MMELLRICIFIAGIIFLISFLLMAIRLKQYQKYSFNDMRHNPVWPIIIFKYKEYFENNYGKVPTLYYIAMIGGSACIVLLLINLLWWISSIVFQ